MSDTKITYVYLTSVEHSGSTLLACLLGAHPHISTVGEFGTPFPKTGNCSCGNKYKDCPFWQEWAFRAEQEGIPFDIGNLDINIQPDPDKGFWEDLFYYQFPYKSLDRMRDVLYLFNLHRNKQTKTQIQKSITLAKLLCKMQNTNIFLDTTKNPLQIRFLKKHSNVDLKMICLVRDGRAVMHSLLSKEKTYTPENAVDSWLWGNRNMERAAAHYMDAKDVYRLRLEDLCSESDKYIQELLSFIGADPTAHLEFGDNSNTHIVGNKMRFHFDGNVRQPDESWRTELSEENLQLFESKAGHINRLYGYR